MMFLKWVLVLIIVTFNVSKIFAAETGVSTGEMPISKVEAKDRISGFQLKLRKGFDPNLSVSASPDYKPEINHIYGASLGFAKNNHFSPGFMGSANVDKFNSKDPDNGEQGTIVAGVEANATFAFFNYLVPYAGLNLSRFYDTGENPNKINYKAGFGFQLGVFGQVWKNIGYALSYQETKNSIKISSPDFPPGYSPPGINVKMNSLALNVVVTI